jgi:very-short-patch-repair endonuclease
MNTEEGKVVLEKIQWVKQTAPHLSVGVVTPFAAQRDWLRDEVDGLGLASEVLVDTAYGFQGDERDVMFFSAVVAPGITPGACQWVEQPPNLINVALTRAREALFVVADFDFCRQQNGLLRHLADYCRDVQVLRDTSPAELSLYSWMIVEGLTPVVHPRIGDHEVDFTLKGEGGTQVAVEVDGAEHHDDRVQRDRGINAYLEGRGFRVVRISGRAAMETPHDVIHQITTAMSSATQR